MPEILTRIAPGGSVDVTTGPFPESWRATLTIDSSDSAPAGTPACGLKVLVISYHFPPDAAVGAIRPAKFVKYLRRLGWQPYVLTVREEYAPVQDEARCADVAALPVKRTRVWPTPLQVALNVRDAMRVRRRTAASGARGAAVRQSGTGASLKRYMNSVFELPDKQVGWLLPAVFSAHRMIQKQRIDVVLVSSPPRTTALIGLLLSYIGRVPVVTDLRDPWFIPYLKDEWFRSLGDVADSRSPVRDTIEEWLERKILERSARVITTTERHALALRKAYPALAQDRVCSIPNGFDAEDLEAAIDAAEPAGKFALSYLGTLYLHRTPRRVFEALSELIREGRLPRAEVEVNLIGDVRSTLDGSVEELIATYGLTDCVRMCAAVSYNESLKKMMEADVLLLFAPHQYCSVPAKAFEYLATGKPILCLADHGATADLINSTGAGVVVPPDDVGAIKAALERLFVASRRGSAAGHNSRIWSYERGALSAQLAGVLMDTVGVVRESARCAV